VPEREIFFRVPLTEREVKLTILAMSASQVPIDVQKEVFELVQKYKNLLNEAT
jgi:hypothetical protein